MVMEFIHSCWFGSVQSWRWLWLLMAWRCVLCVVFYMRWSVVAMWRLSSLSFYISIWLIGGIEAYCWQEVVVSVYIWVILNCSLRQIFMVIQMRACLCVYVCMYVCVRERFSHFLLFITSMSATGDLNLVNSGPPMCLSHSDLSLYPPINPLIYLAGCISDCRSHSHVLCISVTVSLCECFSRCMF